MIDVSNKMLLCNLMVNKQINVPNDTISLVDKYFFKNIIYLFYIILINYKNYTNIHNFSSSTNRDHICYSFDKKISSFLSYNPSSLVVVLPPSANRSLIFSF